MKKRKINSLYIHIPFCNKICEYCDFTKVYYLKKFSKPYIDKLTLDLDKVRKLFCKFNTIYIGGGSPSALSFNELKKLLNKTKKLLKFNGEFTIELNPEDITINKLIILKKNRVNRVSIGIQTFNEKILNEINRNYNINYFELISLVKKYFKNINVDFIYGFKNQTLEELKLDLSKFISLNIDHISIYSLTINKGTIFYNKNYPEIDDEKSRVFYDYIVNFLNEHGYYRYEVSNFAKYKKYSKHNLNYWNNGKYLGIGSGAHGYIDNVRYSIDSNIINYIKNKPSIEKEEVTLNLLEEYYFITNLRKTTGFSIKNYNKTFKKDFFKTYQSSIEKLIRKDLIIIEKNRVFCTNEGMALLDQVILEFIKKI